jgi:hypothetical protein
MSLPAGIMGVLELTYVSSDIFTHHQEHLNCITASDINTYVAAGWYYGNIGSNTPMIPAGNDIRV